MFTITGYEPRYRQAIDDLLFYSYLVHSHMDWHDLHEWLNTQQSPVRLAWQGERLVGALLLSTPLNHTAWFRLMALSEADYPGRVLRALWEDIAGELRQQGVRQVSVLVSRTWVEKQISELGFTFDENIITLQRNSEQLPTLTLPSVTLREMLPTETQQVAQVDHAAFAPPWQMALDELQQARRVAAISTIALRDDVVVGYQISTLYREGAHLARLAVAPDAQRSGIASALLQDVLRRFLRRGVSSMTVNTQASNLRSQQLYRHFGFERNGYDLPVWSCQLEDHGSARNASR